VPLYEYECAKCGKRFEKIEKITAPQVQKCPACGGRAERLLAPPAIQFKGSGWYVTDYAGKSRKPETAGKAETKETPQSGEGKKAHKGAKESGKEGG
jgi:putative FmdB family regulatory protein